ncbi:MAG: hypothetical protein A4E55_00115 [Pelotomaculum sp. PtaU1.Bin035]|nr:MAG: hypothetical protein A4E55_00115 [Pelotomaculum sp. PtaU1.Bin035]
MEKVCMVRSVQRYDFVDRVRGNNVKGVKIVCEGVLVNDDNYEGYKDFSITTRNMSLYDRFRRNVPGEFTLYLEEVPSRRGFDVLLVDAKPYKSQIKPAV